ncbi:hypothetical protein PQC55_gp096 [Escherichia phage vB_EcoP-CHD5UKE1]|uniref:Uncharacterized protein n=1 Tax=Escherichia phage vB_EcoP-CHD5UKE1 TaxID=2865805 RepID=A0ABX9AFJ3_9CAUD|nr:hypothetical protein PQC55_gp096 [Escherichia phage vB_EcoP-CHD5UKE1]QZI80592.1 hypothetical protein CHD5UKE1_0096 [Escherichia phage vB_EcoP-CHD5UKE1]
MSYSDSTNLILIYFPYGADARERNIPLTSVG